MGGLFYFAAVLLAVAPKVADAFRAGGGVRFEEFWSECVTALDMSIAVNASSVLAATG
jgi:hypothetical protein